jgi:hypothetical protein
MREMNGEKASYSLMWLIVAFEFWSLVPVPGDLVENGRRFYGQMTDSKKLTSF